MDIVYIEGWWLPPPTPLLGFIGLFWKAEDMLGRRKFIICVATAGLLGVAGCSSNRDSDGGSGGNGDNLEESGTVTNSDHTKNLDVEEGETIRIEANNEEGEATLASLTSPEGEQIFSNFVETEDTFTHTAEQGGVFSVIVSQPDGTASYQIYLE